MALSPDEASDRFDTLRTTKSGQPVVTLMQDPELGDGGYLSLVDRGANGRRIMVVKGEDLKGPGGNELTPHASGGVTESEAVGFLERLFAPLLERFVQKQEATAKGDRPVTFEAVVALPELMDTLWTGTDGLIQTFRNILMDDEILDKRGKMLEALAGFDSFVRSKVEAVPALKADDLSGVAEVVRLKVEKRTERASAVRKEGRVISASNLDKLKAAEEALSTAQVALQSLMSVTQKGEEMEAETAAQRASEMAIKTAKDHGVTDKAELIAIGTAASTAVYKAAVSGPPQPGIPTTELQRQRREAGGESRGMGMPEGALLKTLNSAFGASATKGLKTDQDALDYLVAQVHKNGKGLEELGEATVKAMEPVLKALNVPAPSAQGAGSGNDEKEKDPVAKGGDKPDPFAGTALGD